MKRIKITCEFEPGSTEITQIDSEDDLSLHVRGGRLIINGDEYSNVIELNIKDIPSAL